MSWTSYSDDSLNIILLFSVLFHLLVLTSSSKMIFEALFLNYVVNSEMLTTLFLPKFLNSLLQNSKL